MEHRLRAVELMALKAAPALFTFLLVLISLFPERLVVSGQWMPHWVMISLYFCALFRRSSFPLWLVFAIGLVQDAITGLPLGSTSFVYLGFFVAIMLRRRYLVQKSFIPLWFGFALIALFAAALQWLVLSLYHMTALPFTAAAIQWAVTVCIYPLLHIILSRWLLLVLSLQTKEHISRNYAHRSHL